MPVIRVNYVTRVCMALANLARAGQTKFSQAVIIDRLKEQNLPPIGKYALQRVHVILLDEIKKGNVEYLSRSKGTYKMTATGVGRYVEPDPTPASTRSSPDIPLARVTQLQAVPAPLADPSDHGDPAAMSSAQTVNAVRDIIVAFAPVFARLKSDGLMECGDEFSEVGDSDITDELVIAFSNRVQSLVPILKKVMKESEVLRNVVECIDTEVNLRFRGAADSRLVALLPGADPLVKKFVEFARTALSQHTEVTTLKESLAQWGPERLELMSEIQELNEQIEALTSCANAP